MKDRAGAPSSTWWKDLTTPAHVKRRRKLIEALRSGEHKQCLTGDKNRDGGVCALQLGVKIGLYRHWVEAHETLLIPRHKMDRIILMNDREKKPFPEIADFIEKLP